MEVLANAIGDTRPVIEFFATSAPCAMATMGGSDFFLLRIPLRTRHPLAVARPVGSRGVSSILLPEGFGCGGTCLVRVRTTVPRCSEENLYSY